jgi:hypothetical protein
MLYIIISILTSLIYIAFSYAQTSDELSLLAFNATKLNNNNEYIFEVSSKKYDQEYAESNPNKNALQVNTVQRCTLYYIDENHWRLINQQIKPELVSSTTGFYVNGEKPAYRVERGGNGLIRSVSVCEKFSLQQVHLMKLMPDSIVALILSDSNGLKSFSKKGNDTILAAKNTSDTVQIECILDSSFKLKSYKDTTNNCKITDVIRENKIHKTKIYTNCGKNINWEHESVMISISPINIPDLAVIDYRLDKNTIVDFETNNDKRRGINSNDLLADPAFQP